MDELMEDVGLVSVKSCCFFSRVRSSISRSTNLDCATLKDLKLIRHHNLFVPISTSPSPT